VGAACATDVDCDDGVFCTGVLRCLPEAPAADARGCVAPPRGACLAGQTCSESAQTCITDCITTADADGDGHEAAVCGGDDCDDADPLRFPGNAEVCDVSAHDEDCDPSTFGYRDQDTDGAPDARCCNGELCGSDCNDLDPTVNPNTTEACDGFDNDCDGLVDEAVDGDLYPDVDGDGAGDRDASPVVGCGTSQRLVSNMNDCDDANPASHVGAPEICDLADNDCDGNIDEGAVEVPWYVDGDGDTFGDASQPSQLSCVPVSGRSTRSGDCDDAAATTFPGAPELCDRVDNDCSTDGGEEALEDVDGDGHASALAACSLGEFPKDDCDDAVATVYGGAPELCDRLDNDCSVDGGLDVSEDADNDMHAPMGATCSGGFPVDDCDDTLAATYTGAPELCDRVDNDCSSGGGVELNEDSDNDGHAASGAACTGGFDADDCDDNDAAKHPGANESCDRVDSNCSNGGGAEPAEDQDGDSYSPAGALCTGGFPRTDCRDGIMSINPGASDICNGANDDCDGVTDEGCAQSILEGSGTANRTFDTSNGTHSDASSQCPAGFYVVGFTTWVLTSTNGSTSMQGMRVRCVAPTVGNTGVAPFDYSVGHGASHGVTSVVGLSSANSSSGYTLSQEDLLCPDDTFVTRVHSGGFQITCAPLTITGSQGNYGTGTGVTTVVGSTHGGLNPGACPAGWLIDGISGGTGAGTPAFDSGVAHCREVTVGVVAP
jgi:hypothetical protein